MKKEATTLQILGVSAALMIAIFTAWVNLNIAVADINSRTATVEKETTEIRAALQNKVEMNLYLQSNNNIEKKLDNIEKKLDRASFIKF